MKKYSIEGNINFFDELYKSLDDSTVEPDNLCLISNMPLVENHVELVCGHKFNYIPLFKDLVNHRKKYVTMEIHRFKLGEIRCPYCRCKQNKMLPYIEEFGLPKEHGINWIDSNLTKPITGLYHIGKCQWGNENECINQNVCSSSGTGKDYCVVHNRIIIQKLKYEKMMVFKQAKKAAKEEIKQSVKLAKLLAKLQDASNNNIILGETCQAILKSGSRKGQPCGAKSKANGCCLRHTEAVNVVTIDP